MRSVCKELSKPIRRIFELTTFVALAISRFQKSGLSSLQLQTYAVWKGATAVPLSPNAKSATSSLASANSRQVGRGSGSAIWILRSEKL